MNMSFTEFEESVEVALAGRTTSRDHANVWMRSLKLVRPDVHGQIADHHIDPIRHASKLSKARDYARSNW
jgi:hypothetical protein